jgi:DNA polymerase-4
VEIARRLQEQIRAELRLPCSIGIAANKLVAKMATDAGKAANRSDRPPFAILEVLPGQEAAFIAPLPIQALWGVGPKTAEHMKRMGIRTIGDLTRLPESYLVECFGKNGYDLLARARGLDDRPVETSHNAKSISQETTFDRDVAEASVLRHTLLDLSRHVGFRLRKSDLAGATVRLKMRWSDFSTISRQVTLEQPTDQDRIIFENVWNLFEHAWPPGKTVRLIGVAVSSLGPQHHQLSLWDQSSEKERRLLAALDDLRERYGEEVVFRGYEIEKDND